MAESNEKLAEILGQMAFLAELRDENPFKVRALANSANIIGELPKSLSELIETGEIKKIPGVGKGTQAIVAEFVSSGKVSELEELKKGFPDGLLELREVRGLGPRKIKQLYSDLGIASLAELEYACQENRLLDLKGFGEKTQSSILKNIKALQGYKGKVILPVALAEAEELKEALEKEKGISRAEITGAVRRHDEIVGELELLVSGKGAEAALGKEGFVPEGGAFTKTTERGMKARVRVAPEKSFDSVWEETSGEIPSGRNLVEETDIKGVFHLHTTWSDGKNTLEEMVKAAEELGYEYLGVSDHSQTAFYAHGLDEKRVLEQKEEIAKVQKKYPSVKIFHGIESDILADGSLDYPKSFLKSFDFVIASVHGQMKMKRDDMTRRICRALENPATTWLGHLTGRILLGREAYDFDLDEVLKCAAANGKSIELNANPYRLDVDWRLLPRLVKMGIGVGIFPDAHSAGGLTDTKYGVWMARKAGLHKGDIQNTKTRAEMEKWLEKRRL